MNGDDGLYLKPQLIAYGIHTRVWFQFMVWPHYVCIGVQMVVLNDTQSYELCDDIWVYTCMT